MYQLNLHPFNPIQPFGHAFGEVHGAVLTSRTAERDLKVSAAVFEIFIDRLADERFRRIEEAIHLVPVAVEEFGNGLSRPVQPRSDSSQYGFGIARQSNTKPPPLSVLSSGNPRLYEKDMILTFIRYPIAYLPPASRRPER